MLISAQLIFSMGDNCIPLTARCKMITRCGRFNRGQITVVTYSPYWFRLFNINHPSLFLCKVFSDELKREFNSNQYIIISVQHHHQFEYFASGWIVVYQSHATALRTKVTNCFRFHTKGSNRIGALLKSLQHPSNQSLISSKNLISQTFSPSSYLLLASFKV